MSSPRVPDAVLNKMPPRVVPLLYLGAAHAALALACVLVAWSPRAVAGFFYHSWMIAIVHLVTLGWITLSILGAFYIVGPAALQMPMPARRSDYAAWALAVTGVAGMVGHFWIAEYGGMVWSAAAVVAGATLVIARVLRGLARAKIAAAVKLHIALASANFLLAASMGMLLGLDKVYHFLPGYVLSNVFAHAHLAAVGWATMMVVGIAYRLLPMTLPAKPPAGRSLFLSAVLIETGVLGLFTALVLQSPWARLFGVLIVAGLAAFAAHVAGMIRSPRPRQPGAPAVDFAIAHAAAAGLSLAVACALGLYLLFATPSDVTLRAATAYGVVGLLGFLGQMVVAMETRLLPLFAWYWAYAGTGFKGPVPPPHAMRNPTLQGLVLSGWAFGVPALAVGFFLNAVPLVDAGAWALLTGVSASAFDTAGILAHAFSAKPPVPGAGFPAQLATSL